MQIIGGARPPCPPPPIPTALNSVTCDILIFYLRLMLSDHTVTCDILIPYLRLIGQCGTISAHTVTCDILILYLRLIVNAT